MNKSLTHILSGDLWGGAESQMLMQITEQINRSDQNNLKEVKVLLFNELETFKRYKKNGINCVVCPEDKGILSLIKSCLKNYDKDSIIVTHGYKELFIGAVLKFSKKVKLIATVHGLNEPSTSFFNKLKSSVYEYTNFFLLKYYADKVICVSNSIKKHLNIKHSEVIWNCVDFSNEQVSDALKLNSNTILMVGRLVPIKRFDLAIKAVAKLKKEDVNIKLQIAGSGPLEKELQSLISTLELKDQVELLGFRNDIAKLLKESSMYLICSDLEGIPTALLEALSLRTPSIATAVGGIPEVIEALPKGSCILTAANDVELLADAIKKRLNNLEVSMDVANTVKEKFSKNRAAKDFFKMLLELN